MRTTLSMAILTTGCLLATTGCRTRNAPSSVADRFSGEHALEQVARFVDLGDRVSGTPGAARAADWLANELKALGIETGVDAFTDDAPGGPTVFRNVIGRIPGRTRERVLLISHYDTKAGIENFVGANDSGSSTGLLLEFARVMRAADAPPYPFDVWLCFVDGEECVHRYGPNDGLHGSRRLAESVLHDGAPLPKAAIVVDMVGDRCLNLTIPPNSTPHLARQAMTSARRLKLDPYVTFGSYAVIDDHIPFLERGLPALLLIDFEFGSAPGLNDYWHTPEDTMDKLSARSLDITGRIVLDLIETLGQ